MAPVIDLVPWDDDVSSSVITKWWECAQVSPNLRAALQTPEWVNYRWRRSSPTFLATLCEGNADDPVAVTPLARSTYPLRFSVAGWNLGRLRIDGYLILGNVPLLPESDEIYLALLERLMASPWAQGIQVLGVPKTSPFWRFLEHLEGNGEPWMLYTPEQPSHRYFWIEMPASFEEWARKFTAKDRYNRRRELTLLEKDMGGPLELVRASEPGHVKGFLGSSRAIAERSWQRHLLGLAVDEAAARQELLEGMARRGILRSYVLNGGPRACAYLIGFQLNGVFYLTEIAYDREFARSSPGKTLLFLALKDLFETNAPRVFYFGPGEASYKESLANRFDEEVTLLILKKNASNLAKVWLHQTFKVSVERTKSLVKCTQLRRPA